MITIIIADDQTLMRDGLETILSLEDDMTVVSTANNGEQVYNLVKEHRPNIVLMDIQMPIQDGIRSSEAIKRDFPETVILILTTFSDEDYIVEALVSGASGYLLKDMPGDKLIDSIRDAAKGQLMMPPRLQPSWPTGSRFYPEHPANVFDYWHGERRKPRPGTKT